MKDGFRSSIVGFIASVALGMLFILTTKWLGKEYLGVKFDAYFLGLMGIIGACLGWLVRFTIGTVTKSINKMRDEIDMKADKTYVEEKFETAKMYVDEHKENNKEHFELIHEFMTSMDSKLDKLIELNKK